jgi:hypothetical protein
MTRIGRDVGSGAERRLAAVGGWEPTDDPTLAAMARDVESLDDEERGGGAIDEAPFDLGIPKPRAMDLRKLWKLGKKKPDPQVLAALGPSIPILLAHSVTAFPVGPRTPRVWGIRYHSAVFGVDADTVDLQPATELLDIATVGSKVDVGVSLGGQLEVLPVAKDALNEIPGVTLNDAKVSASLDEKAAFRIRFTLSVPKVISGPDANGGAGWQLYAQDRRLEGHQALLQTLLVPKGTVALRIDVVSSVAAAGWFGPREWHFESESFEVALDGT